jgi:hypothetical protein
MMDRMRQLQQGDVLFQQVASIPDGARRLPNQGQVVVARGEATGHNHVITSDRAGLWELTRNGVTVLYLDVETPVTLVHDEHKTLPIPPGIYRIGRIKEYDYFSEMERPIVD